MYQSITRLLDLPKSTSQKQKQFHAWLKNKDWPAIEAVVNDKLNEQELKLVKNWLNQAFYEAAKEEDIYLMTYLLSSPNLKRHANIKTRNKVCWALACHKSNIEMMKFLTSSPLLSQHMCLDSKNDHALNSAVAYSDKKMLDYLFEEKNKNLWSNYEQHQKNLYHSVVFAANLENWDILEYLLNKPSVNLAQIKEDILAYPVFLRKDKVCVLIDAILEKKALSTQLPLSTISPPHKISGVSTNNKIRKI